MKLLLVDGSNMVMRAAFGGQLSPHIGVTNATGLIERAIRNYGATHMVIALDASPSGW